MLPILGNLPRLCSAVSRDCLTCQAQPELWGRPWTHAGGSVEASASGPSDPTPFTLQTLLSTSRDSYPPPPHVGDART